jgi:hypothetical protein
MAFPDWRYLFVKYVGIVQYCEDDDFLDRNDWDEAEWTAIQDALEQDDLAQLR